MENQEMAILIFVGFVIVFLTTPFWLPVLWSLCSIAQSTRREKRIERQVQKDVERGALPTVALHEPLGEDEIIIPTQFDPTIKRTASEMNILEHQARQRVQHRVWGQKVRLGPAHGTRPKNEARPM